MKSPTPNRLASRRATSWRWMLLGGWSGSILLLIPFANRLWTWISALGGGLPLRYGIALFAFVGLGVVVVRFRRRPAALAWTLVFGFALVGGMIRLDAAAERIHLAQYFVLGWLAFSCFAPRFGDSRAYLAAVLMALVVGAADEALQWLTPGRYWDLRDLGFNLLGASVAQAWIALALRPRSVATKKGVSVESLAEDKGWWLATVAVVGALVLIPMWLE